MFVVYHNASQIIVMEESLEETIVSDYSEEAQEKLKTEFTRLPSTNFADIKIDIKAETTVSY